MHIFIYIYIAPQRLNHRTSPQITFVRRHSTGRHTPDTPRPRRYRSRWHTPALT